MDPILTNYNARLSEWRLDLFRGEFLNQNYAELNPKFHSSGIPKSFYGLTVVAFIDPETALHQKLSNFQNRIRSALASAGLESIFSFLDPLSFHMTLCDIVAGSEPLPLQQMEGFIQAARKVFPKLGKVPDLSCTLTGIGVDVSLLLLARFEKEASLKACLDLENQLKHGLGVDERSFLGHVSLAYFVQVPGADLERIKRLLAPFSEETLGQFPISKIDLCYFRDMNTYRPLMSLDLRNGSFCDYSSSIDLATLTNPRIVSEKS